MENGAGLVGLLKEKSERTVWRRVMEGGWVVRGGVEVSCWMEKFRMNFLGRGGGGGMAAGEGVRPFDVFLDEYSDGGSGEVYGSKIGAGVQRFGDWAPVST